MVIVLIVSVVVLVAAVVALIAIVLGQRSELSALRANVVEPGVDDVDTSTELARLVAALEAVELGVVVVDPSGEVAFENGVASRLMTSSDSRAIVRQATIELISEAATGRSGRREVDLFGPPKATYLVVASPLVVSSEAPQQGVVVVIEDISERRRTEQVRRDFVTNISHELKTPVGALGLLAETVDAETDPATVARFTKRIVEEVHRLAATIDDLLELSRIEFADDLELTEQVLGPIVAEAAARLDSAAAAREIELKVIGDPDRSVFADQRQLTSALSNLIENAIKYGADASVVTIDMGPPTGGRDGAGGGRDDADGHGADGDVTVISVSDRGDGIPTRDLDRIFERFYRVDRARSRVTGGTGLGLAIVRHIVNNHGGSVTVTSKEGQGSTFTVKIPARNPALSATPRPTESQPT